MNPLPVTVGRDAATFVVERNWQNVSELGVFRVVETETLEMVNRLWNRDLCATPLSDLCVFDSVSNKPFQQERHEVRESVEPSIESDIFVS